MTLPSLLSRLIDQGRSVGAGRMARVAPAWFLRREFKVFVRDLTVPLPDMPSGDSSWVPAPIGEGNLVALEQMGPPLKAGEVRRRWAQGHEGFLWWVEGRPAHYYWITRHSAWLPYVSRTFRPQPGDVLILDVYTYPEFRRRGIDTLSGIDYLHRARASGLRRLIALVAAWNAPALHVARERMGARPVGSLGVRNLLIARRHFATGLVLLEDADAFSVLSPTS